MAVRKPVLQILLAGLLITLASCGNRIDEIAPIILDAPPSDVSLSVGQTLYVRAHSNSDTRPGRMTLVLNGQEVTDLTISKQEPDPPLWVGEVQWLFTTPGDYPLLVRMIAAGGDSFDTREVRVRVSGMPTVTVVPLMLPPQTLTPFAVSPVPLTLTPSSVSPVLLTLTADSTSLAAGQCTFLRWSVSAPQVQSIDLNGKQVPPQGEMQVCPCFTTGYDLIVLAGDKYAKSVTINVTGQCVAPTTPPPATSIQFWADDASVSAGSCTVLRWQTTNALKVYLDGQVVAANGKQRICLCNTETHTLGAGFVDGSKQERMVTINVTGTCVTEPPPTEPPTEPPPPQDTTPPPVPAPLGPGSTDEKNPPDQYCPVTLTWSPVSDPSGVSYRVQLDKMNNVGTWSTIGTWSTSATTYAVPNSNLFCDYTAYRWRVRAVDGAGNKSNWSVWFFYEMPIP